MSTKKMSFRLSFGLPASMLGALFLALGLFLCYGFTAQAHVGTDVTSRLFQDLAEGNWLDAVTERQRSFEGSPEKGPQVDRFDAVDVAHPETLVDARCDWQRLDAALARAGTASLGVSSEALSGNGLPPLRHPRGTSAPSSADAAPQAALSAAPPILPLRSAAPVALPVGTPLCYLPAARGLVIFSLPPPLC